MRISDFILNILNNQNICNILKPITINILLYIYKKEINILLDNIHVIAINTKTKY